MSFEEASELKQKNQHLIGQFYRGSAIEDLVIAPIDPNAWSEFVKTYVQLNFNANRAMLPYTNMELDIVAFFNRAQIHQGFMFFTSLHSLKEELQVL
jgi:hypothetical protein